MGGTEKMKRNELAVLFFFLCFSAKFQRSFSAANQPPPKKKPAQTKKIGSSAVFPIYGNVYPLGYVDLATFFRDILFDDGLFHNFFFY